MVVLDRIVNTGDSRGFDEFKALVANNGVLPDRVQPDPPANNYPAPGYPVYGAGGGQPRVMPGLSGIDRMKRQCSHADF